MGRMGCMKGVGRMGGGRLHGLHAQHGARFQLFLTQPSVHASVSYDFVCISHELGIV